MEKLYNNILLPDAWPPRDIDPLGTSVLPVPYLVSKPDVIDIRVGRQLFVDDFLISRCEELTPTYHQAVKYEGNPIFTPETTEERDVTLPGACPKAGGVWYDKKYGKFRMWYEAGWLNRLALAESEDGLHWTRPVLDVKPGTNVVLDGMDSDSNTVFIDEDAPDERKRYKLFFRGAGQGKGAFVATSPDGIHWEDLTETDVVGDRSTAFYNPFRKKWIYSIRELKKHRYRAYRECDDLIAEARDRNDRVTWLRTDELDERDPLVNINPHLYNFDAVAYESILLGMFEIFKGPHNNDCAKRGIPKITELIPAYSRDGFHFSRPCRKAFIPASRERGSWDRGYVQSAGGVCLVREDELWFYYCGFAGDESNVCEVEERNCGMYANSATGLAKLRRDGFVSMDGTGTLVTEKLCTKEGFDKLFLNVNAENGCIRVAILDENGIPLPGLAEKDCVPFTKDSTCARIEWQDRASCPLPPVFRVKFFLENASLYAFWFTDDKNGDSHGYTAAGCPEGD